MQLTFLGGAGEVGASSTLIEIGDVRFLVDAGIRISGKADRSIRVDQLPDLHQITEAGGIDFILVTHSHTDHTGCLGLVVERYPDVPVFATEPTIELVKVLQADAQRIMRARQEEEGELPLFDEVTTQRLLEAFQPVMFRQPFDLGEDIQVTYYPSGHIVGAASIVVESDDGVLVMSGDLSVGTQRVVGAAELPRLRADMLVLESTYGGKLHANRQSEERRLIAKLKETVEHGGKVLIPAFALGRAQEVLQILLANTGEIDVPVFVDGMVRSVCGAYDTFREYLPKPMLNAAGENPLFFRDRVVAVKSAAHREEIVSTPGPAIIVSSSGMLTGGPSAFYAHELAGSSENAIFLTGYQDEEAPGRFLQKMMREREADQEVAFKLGNRSVTLRCVLDTYSLSAHADESELISIAEALDPTQIALVHGDVGARHSLAIRLRDRKRTVALPASGQTITITAEQRIKRFVAQSGNALRPADPKALWELVRSQSGRIFTSRRLALMWWGSARREQEMRELLRRNPEYFAEVTRGFRAVTPEQITLGKQREMLLNVYPDLVGNVIILRTRNGHIHVGIVTEVSTLTFQAAAFGATGSNFPYDDLVWVVGRWDGTNDLQLMKGELGVFVRQVMLTRHSILSPSQRKLLIEAGNPVQPLSLLPTPLPEGVSELAAITGIASLLTEDGAEWSEAGLRPREFKERCEPMEMNHVRQTVLETFPPEAGLRKPGFDFEVKRLTLAFNFPARAQVTFAKEIEWLRLVTGWDIVVSPNPNHDALRAVLVESLGSEFRLLKFRVDKEEVVAEAVGAGNVEPLAASFFEQTGLTLKLLTTRQTFKLPFVTAASGNLSEAESPVNKLKQLKELFDAGLVTESEYKAKKTEILSRL